MKDTKKFLKENFNATLIGIDEPFMFNCTMCGKCCRNRDDILLTPKDVFRMAKELNILIGEFIKQYCEVYIGSSSKIAVIRLQSVGIDRRCPLLKGNRCSVHDVKPGVCAMFPIGRCISLEDKSVYDAELTPDDIKYIFTNPNCGDKRKVHTVREWFKDFNMSAEDEFFIKWQQTVAILSQFIHDNESKMPQEKIEAIQKFAFMVLYVAYDFDKDFLPQFESNAEIVKNKIKSFRQGEE